MEFKNIKIKGVPEKVKVSNTGIIYYDSKIVNSYLIKGKSHTHGYQCCSITGVPLYIHRLVAQAFVNNPKPLIFKTVIHIDRHTLNNNSDNLTWGSNQEIADYRKRNNITHKTGNKSEEFRGASKISYPEALKVAERLDNGETARAISKEFDVSEMSIIRIRKRYCKKKTVSPRYSKEIKNTVIKLLYNHNKKDVARITGIRYETIRRWDIASKPDC